ncbi:MAG: imelysin family protein [Puniceicoccales bacterium]
MSFIRGIVAGMALLAGQSAWADLENMAETPPGQPYSNQLASDFINHYARLNYELYRDATNALIEFNMALYEFEKNPTEVQFENLKELWIEARKVYGKTEVFRFSDGPVDTLELEPLINAWPIDEGLIDYTRDDPASGIVNNPEQYPDITPGMIAEMNEVGGEANVTTGWHAVEFLLWGQDFYEDGPGRREWTDYTEAENADRRMRYLVVSTELLRHHLSTLMEEWSPDNYDNASGAFFLKPPPKILSNIFRGMSTLAGKELASERMGVALRNRSQEDEHSCFSDTTHNDLVANIEGWGVIFYGEYVNDEGEAFEGVGIYDLVLAVDPQQAEVLKDAYEKSVVAMKEVPAPFDQAILAEKDSEEYKKVQAAISSLWPLVYAMSDASDTLKLN